MTLTAGASPHLPSRRQGGVKVAQKLGQRTPAPVPPQTILTDPRFSAVSVAPPGAGRAAPPGPAEPPPPGGISTPGGAAPNALPAQQMTDIFSALMGNRPAPGPNVNTQVPPGGGSASPSGSTVADPSAPQGVPSALPTVTDPLAGFNPNVAGNALGDFRSEFSRGGSFQPGTADTSVNPEFERILQERMAGNTGGPTFDEIVSNTYEPQAKLMDAAFDRSRDRAIEDMISRGILDSSESGRAIMDLSTELANNKAALLGQLGLEYEDRRQRSIENALNTMGVLEGNKIQARTTITAANISAAAQVQSASLSAGATVAAAKVGAQARLQEAGLNARVALRRIEDENNRSLLEQGIDPVAFQSDPDYRGSVFEYMEYKKHQEEQIRDIVIERERADLLERGL